MADDPNVRDALQRGIELFNAHSFYEAHEVWEGIWHDADGEDRHLFQGLIQVAAGFFKLQSGMPTGTVKLLERAAEHLNAVIDDDHGLALPPLIDAVQQWQQTAQNMVQSFRTHYDKSQIPRLELNEIVH